MQTDLILAKGTNSTVRIHILDESDESFSLSEFVSAKFAVRSSFEGENLIEKSGTTSTTTTTSEPGLKIKDTYVEISMNSSDTEDLDPGTYIADITFVDGNDKEFTTDLFYVKICPRISE